MRTFSIVSKQTVKCSSILFPSRGALNKTILPASIQRGLGSFASILGILAASSALVTGRWIQRTWRSMKYTAELTGESPFTYYSPGGFEPQMTRREAALILGIREFSTPEEVKTAHRRVMIANHPDRGGSPFLALKINEASALLRGPPK